MGWWADNNASESDDTLEYNEFYRMTMKKDDKTVKKCPHCKNRYGKRCWDHRKAENCKCDIYTRHECTHNFECPDCLRKYKTQKTLDKHKCAKKYQCKICLQYFPTQERIDAGDHGKQVSKKIRNCNDLFVHMPKSDTSEGGTRVLKVTKDEEVKKRKSEAKATKKQAKAKKREATLKRKRDDTEKAANEEKRLKINTY